MQPKGKWKDNQFHLLHSQFSYCQTLDFLEYVKNGYFLKSCLFFLLQYDPKKESAVPMEDFLNISNLGMHKRLKSGKSYKGHC